MRVGRHERNTQMQKMGSIGTGLHKILGRLCGAHFYEGCTPQTQNATSKNSMYSGLGCIKFYGVFADATSMRIVRQKRNAQLQRRGTYFGLDRLLKSKISRLRDGGKGGVNFQKKTYTLGESSLSWEQSVMEYSRQSGAQNSRRNGHLTFWRAVRP